MTNDQIAAALSEVGTLLDLRGENPFRANAYHAGARAVEQLAGLAFLATAGTRVRIDTASALADRVLAVLRKVKGVTRVEACGSLRRRKETVGDLDFLAAGTDARAIMEAFVGLDGVGDVLNR